MPEDTDTTTDSTAAPDNVVIPAADTDNIDAIQKAQQSVEEAMQKAMQSVQDAEALLATLSTPKENTP